MLKPHDYQIAGVDFVLDNYKAGNRGAALFFEPGMGKTITSLLIEQRIRQNKPDLKTLIIAPLRVAGTVWPKEIKHWGFDVSHALCTGTAKKRLGALKSGADVAITNPENIVWLQKQKPEFDFLILDESTKFKTWMSKRSMALRKMLPPYRLILTGTPSPNCYSELFAQIWLLDEGERLGRNIGQFRSEYMHRGGYQNYQWMLDQGAEKKIRERIADICLYQSALDHLDMPSVVHNEITVQLDAKAKAYYKRAEDGILGENEIIKSKYIKTKQIASGSVYNEDQEVVHVHQAKLEALGNLIDELNGKPLLVAYIYQYQRALLEDNFGERITPVQVNTMSHGVDGLQHHYADCCWFTLPDSGEVYEQLNARIYRQGQTSEQVRFHYLLAEGTVDRPILRSLRNKGKLQQDLKTYLKSRKN